MVPARFYFDENVSERLIPALRDIDHDVALAIRLGQRKPSDSALLLDAARLGRIFITLNGRDFQILHEAWRAWSTAWNGADAARHAGILIMRPGNRAAVPVIVGAIDRFIQDVDTFQHRLFRWSVYEDCVRSSD